MEYFQLTDENFIIPNTDTVVDEKGAFYVWYFFTSKN